MAATGNIQRYFPFSCKPGRRGKSRVYAAHSNTRIKGNASVRGTQQREHVDGGAHLSSPAGRHTHTHTTSWNTNDNRSTGPKRWTHVSQNGGRETAVKMKYCWFYSKMQQNPMRLCVRQLYELIDSPGTSSCLSVMMVPRRGSSTKWVKVKIYKTTFVPNQLVSCLFVSKILLFLL